MYNLYINHDTVHNVQLLYVFHISPSGLITHINYWRKSKYLSQETTCLTGNVKPLQSLNKTQISILIKKADKGTTTVIMNKEGKIREGQVLLDKRENYESLALPMVTETSQRVQELIKALYHGDYN